MIKLIIATDTDFGLGYKNTIPWDNKEDLAFFKQMTIGKDILMGRTTYEGLLRRFKKQYFDVVLPGRKNIVLSTSLYSNLLYNYRLTHYNRPVIEHYTNVEKIKSTYRKEYNKELFIIGGTKVIENTIHLVDEIYWNQIKGTYDCDTFLPQNIFDGFEKVAQSESKDKIITYTHWVRKVNHVSNQP